jgi:hypothetical protein
MLRTKQHNLKISRALIARGIAKTPEKICPKCKVTFPRNEYSTRRNGYCKSYCKKCESKYNSQRQMAFIARHPELKEKRQLENRKAQFKRKYNITLDFYNSMLSTQKNVCAICGGNHIQKNRKYLYVDHCHKTGKVRGLLCMKCNSLLGYANDNVDILKSSIDYLLTKKI